MIAYEDFDLRIQADGDRFAVVARRGSQRAVESFDLDPGSGWNIWAPPNNGKGEIERRGAALFAALIHGAVKDLYQQGRGGAGNDAARGMRIRIQIDSRDERLRPFMSIPWEILFDRSADAGRLLALDARRPIVRMIDSNEQQVDPAPLPIKRVLLALSQPSDTMMLKLKHERSEVDSVLRRHGLLPKVLERATRWSLQTAILEEQPQILHFMGHGTSDEQSGEGLLLLENENRQKDPIHASELARFFIGRPAPRLVILTSCVTGIPGPVANAGPFASVAAALVSAGLPAVIAMQAAVRDTNAILFTQRLYEGVVRGDAVEAAIASARIALQLKDREVPDWAAPVLFVRAQGGGTIPITPPGSSTAAAEPRSSTGSGSQTYGISIGQHGQITGDITINHLKS